MDSETAISNAIERGDLEQVKAIVSANPNCLIQDVDDDETPLILAARRDELEIVNYLVNLCWVYVSATTVAGEMAVNFAARNGNQEMVELLLEYTEDPEDTFGHEVQCKLMYDVAWGGNVELFKALEDRFILSAHTVNITHPLLHGAAHRRGNRAMLEYLVKEGHLSPHVADQYGQTPLHIACIYGDADMVRFLVNECGADVQAITASGDTALHATARGGQLDIVRFLIEDCGLDPNDWNADGETCLMRMCWKMDCMRYLVEKAHADVNTQDNYGRNLAHHAVNTRNPKSLRYVVETCHGDVNAQDHDGRTPLHYVALDTHNICDLQLARYLVEQAGADPLALDQDGKRPLDLAEDPELRDYLTKATDN